MMSFQQHWYYNACNSGPDSYGAVAQASQVPDLISQVGNK